MQALLRLYSGSIKALLRLYSGTFTAILRLYQCIYGAVSRLIAPRQLEMAERRHSAPETLHRVVNRQSSKTTVVKQRVGGEKAFCSRNSHLEVRVTDRLKALKIQLLCAL